MACFALAPYVKHRILAKLLTNPGEELKEIGQTYWRDRAFFWWNAFSLAGLGDYWEGFVAERNAGREMRASLYDLRDMLTWDEWDLFSRRLGKERLQPFQYANHASTVTFWTKGGTWHRSSSMTTLLVLKEHLPTRELTFPWQVKLGHGGVQQIERELMAITDPDVCLAPDCRITACEHVRDRVTDLLNRQRRLSPENLPWFFQCQIVYDGRRFRWPHRKHRPGKLRLAGGEDRVWSW